MLKELILRCPNDFVGGLTTFQCLVRMQHYGLPTRLLDITSNPLVALYFACVSEDEDEEDGEVLVFEYEVDAVKYFDSDTVSVIANLSRRPADFTVPGPVDGEQADLEGAIRKFNSDDSIKLLLHDIGTDKPHFLPKIRREDLERVVCVKPRLENPRIIRQDGAFLLFGCKAVKSEPASLEDSAIVARLTINRDEKQNLLDQLRTLGITRATMYPEIERVAMYIKHLYTVPSIDFTKLNPTQRSVLSILQDGLEYSVREVATAVGVTPESARRGISNLQRMGAVELVGSGRERRWRRVKKLEIIKTVKKIDENASPRGPGA